MEMYWCIIFPVHKTISLFSIKDKVEEFNYRKVKLTGSFDHSQEMLIQPRPLASATEHHLPGHRSKSGAHVITRFYCNETK